MDDFKVISWLFLATAIASQDGPAKTSDISAIADGINHAVPTQKEMQNALNWLVSKDLLAKLGNKYSLTKIGVTIFVEAESKSNLVMAIWQAIDLDIRKL